MAKQEEGHKGAFVCNSVAARPRTMPPVQTLAVAGISEVVVAAAAASPPPTTTTGGGSGTGSKTTMVCYDSSLHDAVHDE